MRVNCCNKKHKICLIIFSVFLFDGRCLNYLECLSILQRTAFHSAFLHSLKSHSNECYNLSNISLQFVCLASTLFFFPLSYGWLKLRSAESVDLQAHMHINTNTHTYIWTHCAFYIYWDRLIKYYFIRESKIIKH